MKDKICIIGCGSIGFRHLESILKNKNQLEIYIFEKIQINIINILSFIKDNNKYNHQIKISKLFNIRFLKIDILIISTNSDVRFKIIDLFFKKNNMANKIILEKLVSQNLDDFKKILKIQEYRNTNIYVNCSRRMFSSYKKLKKNINKRKIKKLKVTGSNWGLASNSIHMIDLFGYLSGKIISYQSNCIIDKITPSKRKGFYDFYGKININIDKFTSITMIDKKLNKNYFLIEIIGDDFRYLINESNQIIDYKDKCYELKNIKKEFKTEMQSSLSIKYLNKNISLTKIKESFIYHKILIDMFDSYFQKNYKNKNKYYIT